MFDPSVPEKTKASLLAPEAHRVGASGLDEEARRQQILQSYRLVDTPPEPAYEDIVKMAALMCGTPTAMVSLITEDRQWFKARVGMDATQTPRNQAFCAHAIQNPSHIMEVQDASLDPRFMHNPLVVGEPKIRFYAGAPLLTPSGVAIGTVCVIDRVPRHLTPAMAQGLQALARQAGELLALRRANMDLETLNQSVMELQVELEQHQVKLEGENAELSHTHPIDQVTGLNNERTFERLLTEELGRVERTQSTLALLLADVDQFTEFAKDFGEVAANDALRRVAKALKAQARSYDALFHLGSRRFAVLLPGTEGTELIAVAARFRHAVAAMRPVGRAVRVSVGVSIARSIDAPMDLLQRATLAVEQAATAGGNQVMVV